MGSSTSRRDSLWLTLFALVIGVFCSCATETRVSSEWMSPDYASGPMQKLLVVGVAETDLARLTYEDRFTDALKAAGADAVASHTLLPQAERLNRDDLEEVVKRGNFDGVIVTRLLDVREETTVVPPTTRVSPAPGYGRRGYYGYYGRSYDVVTSPGYTETTEVVRLENKLWSARDGQLVWGVVSETFDKKSTDDGIASVTAKLVSKLQEDGLLAPQ